MKIKKWYTLITKSKTDQKQNFCPQIKIPEMKVARAVTMSLSVRHTETPERENASTPSPSIPSVPITYLSQTNLPYTRSLDKIYHFSPGMISSATSSNSEEWIHQQPTYDFITGSLGMIHPDKHTCHKPMLAKGLCTLVQDLYQNGEAKAMNINTKATMAHTIAIR